MIRPHLAASDCERVRSGWIAQPANTVSSLGFVVSALWLAYVARREQSRRWAAVAGAAAATGFGSVAYHGPGGRASKVLHDLGIASLAGSLVAAHLPLDRRRMPSPPSVGLGIVAAMVHARSRTGGPWCCPDGAVQGHAVFHLLSAAAIAAIPGRGR